MGTHNMVKDGHLGGYVAGGDPGTWCPNLWSWAIEKFGVRSVLDVGCGEGHSTRYFLEQGCDTLGVEGCATAIENTAVPGRVAHHDFRNGPFQPERTYDMIWSCEFLEHVESAYVPHILETFASAAKVILVTHAFPGQTDGHHHVNCQPSSYWIRHIERLGFECSVHESRLARRATLADYSGVNHFARSGLLFIRKWSPAENVTLWQRLTAPIRAVVGPRLKSFRINQGFRLSSVCRTHLRAHKAAKRARKRGAKLESK